MTRHLLVALVISTALARGWAAPAQPQGPRSILRVKAESVRVRIVDASSCRPIASSEVTVHSDNGVRCSETPCGTRSAQWKGTTDTGGYVDVPTRTFDTVTHLKATSHEMVSIDEAEPGPAGTWTVELIADDVFDPPGKSMRVDYWPGYWPVKLVDGSTGRPIADTSTHVVSEKTAVHGVSGKTVSFDLKTNALGYCCCRTTKCDASATWRAPS